MKKFLLSLILTLLCWLGWAAYSVTTPYTPPTLPMVITIEANQNLRQIADILEEQQAIRSPWLFMLAAKWTGQAPRLKAGDYRLTAPVSISELLDRMEKGESIEFSITIPEGWRFSQFRQALDKHPALKHLGADLSDQELLTRLGYSHLSAAEGWFFPDTYRFLRGSSDLDILRRAHTRLRQQLEQAWNNRAPDLPYTSPEQALIMASLIEKETGHEKDRTQIAAVFVNRLKIGMRLQTDPSVIYGVGASYRGNLTKKHLQTDTPYNTYTRAGLPPTPIALPGRAALDAALHPASSSALYFVARGDGTSQFSDTLDQHNQAVRRYILGKKD